MKEITYLGGDAINPQVPQYKIIAHICNDIGSWGRGFVRAISQCWKGPEQKYRDWHKRQLDSNARQAYFELGRVQFVPVEAEIEVANMIGQHGVSL